MNAPVHDLLARQKQRLSWAREALQDLDAALTSITPDAGARSYWRTQGHGPDRIVMDAPPGLEDVSPWLQVRDLLHSHGVRVPEVLARDTAQGFLLLEDLGAPTLAQTATGDNADLWFEASIDQLIKLQSIPVPDGYGHFGQALLQRDAGLFETWFINRHLGVTLEGKQAKALALVQRRLMDNVQAQPQVLTHRDFMPRNLMPVVPGPAVLDFQDCVRGPVAYDPVSMFKDAFLSWPLARVDGWLATYHQRALAAGIPVPAWPVFWRDADWMGVQRHLKILGIFCRLHYRDGKSHYLPDLPRFIAYLDEVVPRHPELAPLGMLLDEVIRPAMVGKDPL